MPEFAKRLAGTRSFLLLLGMVNTAYRKTSLHRDRPKRSLRLASSVPRHRTARGSAWHRLAHVQCPEIARTSVRRLGHIPSSRCQDNRCARQRNCDPSTFGHPGAFEVWWSQTGSNRRPPACKAGALPTELWPLQVTGNRGQGSVRPSKPNLPTHLGS